METRVVQKKEVFIEEEIFFKTEKLRRKGKIMKVSGKILSTAQA
jgi:hypothetical protein